MFHSVHQSHLILLFLFSFHFVHQQIQNDKVYVVDEVLHISGGILIGLVMGFVVVFVVIFVDDRR